MGQSRRISWQMRANIIERGITRMAAGAVVFALLAGGIGLVALHNILFFVFCLLVSATYVVIGWATWKGFRAYCDRTNATIALLRDPQPIRPMPGFTVLDSYADII